MVANIRPSKYTIILFALFSSFSTMVAQERYQDGFVITTKNDTLVGRLNNLHRRAHNYIDFIYPDGNDTVFTPNHISSYEIGNQRFEVVPLPHPTKLDTTFLFAHLLVDGFAKLYVTKLKVDPITPAAEAYLCKKYNENVYYPAGNLKSLGLFFADYPTLNNELINHSYLYTNNLETKLQLFNHYNAWKKHQIDSLAASRVSNANLKVDKMVLEVFMSDSTNLTPESKYALDKITGKLAADPDLDMTIEFVNSGVNVSFEKKTMKAVLLHLNEYDARIDEKIVSIPENQEIKPSQSNGQIVFYYFR